MDKRIRSAINKLLKITYNQIFFPKENLSSLLFGYGLTLIFSLGLLEGIFFLPGIINVEIFLLLAVTFISLNSFLGNFKTGITLSAVSASIYTLVFLPTDLSLQNFVDIAVFITSGILISLLINSSKKVDLALEFGKREKNYLSQINRLTLEKNAVTEEIKAHDEFISIASHELKTPLTTTLLKLQTALDNIRNVSLANFSIQNLLDMLESAEAQTQTLGKMTSDLLNVSLIRNGRMQLELEELDLTETVKEITQRFSEKALKEQIQIQLKITSSLRGLFDRIKIEQVIANLITNAMKYGNRKPILITVSRSGSQACITIKDEGIGVSKDIQDKIFKLFERGVNGNSGLGIGLYVSNQIVKSHKGKLLLSSKPGKGSTFTIELPLMQKGSLV